MTQRSNKRSKKATQFDTEAFFGCAGVPTKGLILQPKTAIFSQGEACKDVMYIQNGHVKLSVVSDSGKEAVVALLNPGDFVGEGALAGQLVRMATATTVTTCTLLVISLKEMIRVLHAEHVFSDQFIRYIVERNIRIEGDLVDQLFNSSEKRLARTLLLLARYGKEDKHRHVLPKVSQETLTEMIGTTRSRVNFFIKKFERLGFIHQSGGLHVNDSLLKVVLND
jgi:CRP-like cAMP-binding protein